MAGNAYFGSGTFRTNPSRQVPQQYPPKAYPKSRVIKPPVTVTGGTDTFATFMLNKTPSRWWRLGEASGTIAVDQMGVDNGTYVGSPTMGIAGGTASSSNTAVDFNGSSQYVTTTTKTPAASVRTWVAICKRDTASTYDPIMGGYDDVDLAFHPTSAQLDLFVNTVQVGAWALPSTLVDGNYHRVVVVMNQPANSYSAYVDGSFLGTYASVTTDSLGTGNISIGYDNPAGGEFFDGKIDEVAIFNYAWTQTEVTELEAAVIAPPGMSGGTYKLKISGGFTDESVSIRTGGTFVTKPRLTKVSGTFA